MIINFIEKNTLVTPPVFHFEKPAFPLPKMNRHMKYQFSFQAQDNHVDQTMEIILGQTQDAFSELSM